MHVVYNMYVCMNACMYYVTMYACVCTYVSMFVFGCMCVCIDTCIVYVYLYACTDDCMYFSVPMYACMFIYARIYKWLRNNKLYL